MGRLTNFKNKLADTKNSIHIKDLEAQVERERKKGETFEKIKQEFLARATKDAHASGQPGSIFEEGKWYLLYPDGHKEEMSGTTSFSDSRPTNIEKG